MPAPEIPIFSKPDLVYDVGSAVRVIYYENYPEYFYLYFFEAGRSIAVPTKELPDLISILDSI